MFQNSQSLHAPLSPQGLFHGIILTVAWVGCEQVAIWSLRFRNRLQWAVYIHGAAMLILLFLGTIGATQIIVYKGLQVIPKTWYHTLLGTIVTCLSPLAVGLGFASKNQESSPLTHPSKLERTKLVHIFCGWVLIAASRIVLYTQWAKKQPVVCIVLFLFDIVAHTAYLWYRQLESRMENSSIEEYKRHVLNLRDEVWIRQIKNIKELQVFHGDYFIFADFVYRLGPLLGVHPGGFQIINQIRGRQVDRFLLGVEPLEKFASVSRVSHTAKSIQLAGRPVARLQRSTVYSLMEEENEAKVWAMNFYQSSKRIYTIYLRTKDSSSMAFKYEGYTDISQLGKYFSLTIGQKTRLYTMVNFLQERTVKLVEEVTKGTIFSTKERQILLLEGYEENLYRQSIIKWKSGKVEKEDNSTYDEVSFSDGDAKKGIQALSFVESNSISQLFKERITCLPLLIKKYDDGQLTSRFLNDNFKGDLKISCPRGRGLALQDLPNTGSKKIVMFAGGTGIYPFADTIDLAFKELLIEKELMDEKKSQLRNYIVRLDPILEERPFRDFEFSLYISVSTMEEIHPITLFQCQFLALHKKMKVYIKSSKIVDQRIALQERYPSIVISNTRYEKVLLQLHHEEISRVYICGPTRMTKTMLEEIERMEWSSSKYVVL